jgi:hypothetical protein
VDYRFYLLNTSGKIQALHEVRCSDDRRALATAQSLFKENRFEVWQSERCVYPGVTIAAPAPGWLLT